MGRRAGHYQRRANLIPNLVATVRASASSRGADPDRDVTQARANATRITVSPEQLNDPAAMQRFQQAQSQLSAAIIPLQRLQEAYPELQSQRELHHADVAAGRDGEPDQRRPSRL